MTRPLVALLGVCALVIGTEAGICRASAGQGVPILAVFPVENLSGRAVPADRVRQLIADGLTSRHIDVLADDTLLAFLRRHRVRYTAGVDTETAEALRQEAGVTRVLIPSIELSGDGPPRVAIVIRLVSTESPPFVIWADDVAITGNDAPGLLQRGVVTDFNVLLGRALTRLTEALVARMESGKAATPERAGKFRPKMWYRAVSLEADRKYTVAVLPFLNVSTRRNAGDILALLFRRHLAGFAQFRVLDSGVVRHELLSARIIMDQGPSISDADTVAALVEADFVLGGRVLAYEDFEGADGVPRVEFSAVMMERKSSKVVWSSDSYNDGLDGVRFFGRGRSTTAHAMATQMVRLTAETIAGASR